MPPNEHFLILWLDDEPHYLENHIAELKEDPRLDVHFVSRVEDAIRLIEEQGLRPDLLIWDMILPPGPFTLKETEDGLKTGARFFERFRKVCPQAKALLFTNVTAQDIVDRFQDPIGNSWLRNKSLDRKQLHKEVRLLLGILEGDG